MTPKQHARVRQVFEAVCDLSPNLRGRYLDRHCADEPVIRTEVESLLALERHSDSFMKTPAVDLVGAS